jgi:hypothetical protein
MERRIIGRGNSFNIDFLVSHIGGNMEINQRKALGISIEVFAALMLIVCVIYEIITPSVKFADMWFSYLVGAILYAIGFLMALR